MSKTNSQQSAAAIRQWRGADDAATIILAAAAQSGVIAEVTATAGSYNRFIHEMTDTERAELATIGGRVRKSQIEAACKFAGTTFADARAKLIVDTPETRAAAAKAFNL